MNNTNSEDKNKCMLVFLMNLSEFLLYTKKTFGKSVIETFSNRLYHGKNSLFQFSLCINERPTVRSTSINPSVADRKGEMATRRQRKTTAWHGEVKGGREGPHSLGLSHLFCPNCDFVCGRV